MARSVATGMGSGLSQRYRTLELVCAAGFPGSVCGVAEWTTGRGRDDRDASASRCPATRALARLLNRACDKLTRTNSTLVAIAERAVTEFVAVRVIINEFQELICKHKSDGLATWIERTLSSPVASFAKCIEADHAAVTAAITSPCSNEKPNGKIGPLKSIKWLIYVAPISTGSTPVQCRLTRSLRNPARARRRG